MLRDVLPDELFETLALALGRVDVNDFVCVDPGEGPPALENMPPLALPFPPPPEETGTGAGAGAAAMDGLPTDTLPACVLRLCGVRAVRVTVAGARTRPSEDEDEDAAGWAAGACGTGA